VAALKFKRGHFPKDARRRRKAKGRTPKRRHRKTKKTDGSVDRKDRDGLSLDQKEITQETEVNSAAIINVFVGARDAASPQRLGGSMDVVTVILKIGSNQWPIDLSRVPSIDEHIRFQNQIYIVQSVMHLPIVGDSAHHVAEITVSLLGP
jgi:hypothetical protein